MLSVLKKPVRLTTEVFGEATLRNLRDLSSTLTMLDAATTLCLRYNISVPGLGDFRSGDTNKSLRSSFNALATLDVALTLRLRYNITETLLHVASRSTWEQNLVNRQTA